AAFPNAKRASACTRARKLLEKPEIRAEIARLREAAHEHPSPAALTLAEKRGFLARIVRAKLAALPEDSDLLDRVSKGGRTVRILPDKLDAIELDNELAREG